MLKFRLSSPVYILTVLLLLWWTVTVLFLKLSTVVSYHSLFLFFINDLLNLTQSPNHSCYDDTILHFSTPYNRRPTQQKFSDSRRDAIGRLTSDLLLVSGAEQTWFCSMPQKLNFYNYITDIVFQITILFSSMTFNWPSSPH